MIMIRISLENCPLITPNCIGTDTVTLNMDLVDAANNTATVVLTGSLNAINEINDSNFLLLNGVSGTTTVSNPSGSVNINATYSNGFLIDENVTVDTNTIDCKGWSSVEDQKGRTNAIMTHENEYLMDHEGNYLAFI